MPAQRLRFVAAGSGTALAASAVAAVALNASTGTGDDGPWWGAASLACLEVSTLFAALFPTTAAGIRRMVGADQLTAQNANIIRSPTPVGMAMATATAPAAADAVAAKNHGNAARWAAPHASSLDMPAEVRDPEIPLRRRETECTARVNQAIKGSHANCGYEQKVIHDPSWLEGLKTAAPSPAIGDSGKTGDFRYRPRRPKFNDSDAPIWSASASAPHQPQVIPGVSHAGSDCADLANHLAWIEQQTGVKLSDRPSG